MTLDEALAGMTKRSRSGVEAALAFKGLPRTVKAFLSLMPSTLLRGRGCGRKSVEEITDRQATVSARLHVTNPTALLRLRDSYQLDALIRRALNLDLSASDVADVVRAKWAETRAAICRERTRDEQEQRDHSENLAAHDRAFLSLAEQKKASGEELNSADERRLAEVRSRLAG